MSSFEVEDARFSNAAIQVYVDRISILIRKGNFDAAVRMIHDAKSELESVPKTLIGDCSIIWMLEQCEEILPGMAVEIANKLETSNFRAIYIRQLYPLNYEQVRSIPMFRDKSVLRISAAFATVGLKWPAISSKDIPFFTVIDKATAFRLQLDGYLSFSDLPRHRLFVELRPKGWQDFEINALIGAYTKHGH